MSNIGRRVSRLEGAAAINDEPPRHVVRVIVRPEEDEDDVIARWRAEHPEAPEDIFFIVRKIAALGTKLTCAVQSTASTRFP